MKIIDLRSDTVTRPTAAMRRVMSSAEVGDDVYGDDPTVNRLEKIAAEMLGFEAALFACSGTQANLISLMTHCGRGDEYIVGQQAHTYKYEGGGAAVLGSIQPQPLDFEKDGTLDLVRVEQTIKPDDFHFARTRLLCLENTQSGKVLPVGYLQQAAAFARRKGLALHLDGARIFNASVKLGLQVSELTQHFDSVSTCLSKGLGAPVGSIVCGSRDFIKEARRWRKVTGGGMRQAGILAAAGIYALENHVERLAQDHGNAELLANGLGKFDELRVERENVQTNMVFIDVEAQLCADLASFLQTQGILISPGTHLRLVTHLDIATRDLKKIITAVSSFFRQYKK
jgi:threonine aldolase